MCHIASISLVWWKTMVSYNCFSATLLVKIVKSKEIRRSHLHYIYREPLLVAYMNSLHSSRESWCFLDPGFCYYSLYLLKISSSVVPLLKCHLFCRTWLTDDLGAGIRELQTDITLFTAFISLPTKLSQHL